jgi:hypothetical protein
MPARVSPKTRPAFQSRSKPKEFRWTRLPVLLPKRAALFSPDRARRTTLDSLAVAINDSALVLGPASSAYPRFNTTCSRRPQNTTRFSAPIEPIEFRWTRLPSRSMTRAYARPLRPMDARASNSVPVRVSLKTRGPFQSRSSKTNYVGFACLRDR